MSKTVSTSKGTQLPLTNLKGKDYLMVAYRLQWLTEDVPSYEIDTELVVLTDEQTVARATVKILDKDGKLVKKAQATKRETKKDFSDHTEKAETAAIGRALAMLGYGTQHALSDLEEGERLADSPLASAKSNPVATNPVAQLNGTSNTPIASTTKSVANGANGKTQFRPQAKPVGNNGLGW